MMEPRQRPTLSPSVCARLGLGRQQCSRSTHAFALSIQIQERVETKHLSDELHRPGYKRERHGRGVIDGLLEGGYGQRRRAGSGRRSLGSARRAKREGGPNKGGASQIRHVAFRGKVRASTCSLATSSLLHPARPPPSFVCQHVESGDTKHGHLPCRHARSVAARAVAVGVSAADRTSLVTLYDRESLLQWRARSLLRIPKF